MRAILLGLLLVTACRTREGTLVEVTVGSTAPIADVAKLAVVATIGKDSRSFEVPLAVKTIPPDHVFGIEVSGKRTGSIEVSVDALSSANVSVGKKSGSVTLVPGSTVNLSLVLGSPDVDMAGASSDGGSDAAVPDLLPTLTITPPAPSVGAGRYLQLSASAPVTWSVMGGDSNGTITADGVYNAPFAPGMYTVVATGASSTAMAIVTVKPLVITKLSGRLGGEGNADGVGASARFARSSDFATARDSYELYIADTDNHVIRHVDPKTGATNTVAGLKGTPGSTDGTGIAARFDQPSSICQASLDLLYVWDKGTGALRQVDVGTGAVGTLMTGAEFGSLSVRALLCTGDPDTVYVVDGALKKLTISTKTFSTVLSSPSGIVAGGVSGTDAVLATSTEVYSVNLSAPTPTAQHVAGSTVSADVDDNDGTAARFKSISAIVWNDGAFLLVDAGACKVKRVDRLAPFGVATVAGNSDSCISELEGLPVDGAGSSIRFVNRVDRLVRRNSSSSTFYLLERGNSVRSLNLSTPALPVVATIAGAPFSYGITQGPLTDAEIDYPSSLAAVGQSLYVSEPGWKELAGNLLRRIDLNAGMIAIAAGQRGLSANIDEVGTAAAFSLPWGLAYDGSDSIYVADLRTVRRFVVSTGAVSTIAGDSTAAGYVDLEGNSARFGSAVGVSFSEGRVFVVDFDYPGAIRQVTPSGMVSTLAGSSTETGYVDQPGSSARFALKAGDVVDLGGTAGDHAGSLFVADAGNAVIRKVTLADGTVATLAGSAGMLGSVDGIGSAARFRRPSAIWFDGNRTLYVGDDATLRAVDTVSGAVKTVAGRAGQIGVSLGPLPASLNRIRSIVRDATGDLYLSVGDPLSDNAILRVAVQ